MAAFSQDIARAKRREDYEEAERLAELEGETDVSKTLWVDPSVKDEDVDGPRDGSAERPFKTLEDAVNSIGHVTEDVIIRPV